MKALSGELFFIPVFHLSADQLSMIFEYLCGILQKDLLLSNKCSQDVSFLALNKWEFLLLCNLLWETMGRLLLFQVTNFSALTFQWPCTCSVRCVNKCPQWSQITDHAM
ncbi:hypothetical protein AVEN_19603-1 [Araneus ventricosus]|uniref:Uncharacterized protein n=1 Tax=Araneus ventricosus TaxID=182803 RepID=A0A4Y2UV81_ARAVE|nr:hypothetical protein AVEN_19603-1 [Araneus ventricosus]